MKVGDFVVGVATADTKWAKHEEVVQLVRQAGSELRLTLITPMEINLPDVSAARPFNTIRWEGLTSAITLEMCLLWASAKFG